MTQGSWEGRRKESPGYQHLLPSPGLHPSAYSQQKSGTHLMKAQVVLHSRRDVEDVAISSHSNDKSIECLKA